jgi:hypothetical protein
MDLKHFFGIKKKKKINSEKMSFIHLQNERFLKNNC